MVVTESLEGTINGQLWYHYDLANDVLYVRRTADRAADTVSEETPEGLLVLRRADNDVVAGVTVVNWWKRFGAGRLPDSIHELEQRIEPWGLRVAA
jgi:hypothetical protein